MSALFDAIRATHTVEGINGDSRDTVVAFSDPEGTIIVQLDWSKIDSVLSTYEAKARLEGVRTKRNRLLAATDWWVLPDRTATAEQLAYRQALRDITNTYSSLDDVVWPTKPE